MTANTAPQQEDHPKEQYSAQIIQFPKEYKPHDEPEADPVEIVSNLLEMKVASAEQALAFVMDTFFRDLYTAGFKIPSDRLSFLIVASVRAAMYRNLGLQHPLVSFVHENGEEIDKILASQLQLIDIDELLESSEDFE